MKAYTNGSISCNVLESTTNFDTYEDPIWAMNYDFKTFLNSSKPFVLFVSDTSLLASLGDGKMKLIDS